jgi:type IV pilus assembly protein PilO
MALLDPIANVPRSQKIVGGLVGLVVLAGLGYFFLISPKIDERASLRHQNDGLQAEVRKASADEANLRPFRLQAATLRKRLQAAKERLPSEKEMPALYRQLSDMAAQSGLQLAVFSPKPPADREDVAAVPITVTCEGNYHQLGAFFSRVGRLPRIVDLGDFRVVGIERPTGTVRADLTLETFMFRPEAPSPGKSDAAAGQAPKPGPAAVKPGAKSR